MSDIVEDIKARLDIVEVVSSYVQLKKTGRNYKGLCPFHSEKTPSFVVSSEKQICHCFGCSKGGDLFNFIEEVEGVSFSEALQVLADRAGLKIENISKFVKKDGKGEKEIYYKAHDLAKDFFSKELYKSKDGKKVLEYLYSRGIKDEIIKEFGVGFAPQKADQLHPYLLKKGISKKILIKSGLISSKSITDDRAYDKFRGRLIFPIYDYMGRVCGFGGRALSKDQMPKYLNSPENAIYNKSRVLYGMYRAKSQIKKEDRIVLVEGYFDVLLPHQEGISNVVAVSGTALSQDQVKLIKRLTSNVVTCFDQDDAGFEATKRSYALLAEQDMVVKTVTDFKGKDPADLVKAEGAVAFGKLIKKAEDFVSFYMKILNSKYKVERYEDRKTVITELLPILKRMGSTDRDYFVRELAGLLNTRERFLYDELESFKLPESHPARKAVSQEKFEASHISLQDIILAIILVYPKLFEFLVVMHNEDDFEEDFNNIYNALSSQYNSARTNLEQWDLDKGILSKISEKLNVLIIYGEERYSGFSQEALESELKKLVDKIKKERVGSRLQQIQKEIIEVEKEGKKENLLKLLTEQQNLLSKGYGKNQ